MFETLTLDQRIAVRSLIAKGDDDPKAPIELATIVLNRDELDPLEPKAFSLRIRDLLAGGATIIREIQPHRVSIAFIDRHNGGSELVLAQLSAGNVTELRAPIALFANAGPCFAPFPSDFSLSNNETLRVLAAHIPTSLHRHS